MEASTYPGSLMPIGAMTAALADATETGPVTAASGEGKVGEKQKPGTPLARLFKAKTTALWLAHQMTLAGIGMMTGFLIGMVGLQRPDMMGFAVVGSGIGSVALWYSNIVCLLYLHTPRSVAARPHLNRQIR
jgi:hypothetical protein